MIKGSVSKIKNSQQKIPVVGWKDIQIIKEHKLFTKVRTSADFYFVHSHVCIPENNDSILAECNYGNSFVACVAKHNIFGTQFHPEKSAPSGTIMLKNFSNWKGQWLRKE